MAQVFSKNSNVLAWVVICALLLVLCGGSWITWATYWSPYTTYVDIPFQQPVPFSHKHHVTDDGIDCRYCHTSVETSSFAGIPSTEICMSCHSRIWNDSPALEPVRLSLANNTSLQWNRVNDLPDYVYFDHSIHVAKGIGCSTCHGRVDQMPLTRKTETLYMRWCLECHRAPQRFIRPRDRIYDMSWQPSQVNQAERKQLVQLYQVDTSGHLTNCGTCHR
jgi:hypothetical protein